MSINCRYVRDWIQGSTTDTTNGWSEIFVYDTSSTNRAVGILPTCNGSGTNLINITDELSSTYGTVASAPSNYAWVKIDLGALYDIDRIIVYHYAGVSGTDDGRMYKMHLLEVSTDDSSWITIQQPENCVTELGYGQTYYLMDSSDFSGPAPTASSISKLKTIINNARSKRINLSSYSFGSYTYINATSFADLQNSMKTGAGLNASFSQVTTDNGYLIEKQDYEEIYSNAYSTQRNITTCNGGCAFNCMDDCIGKCGTACASSCGTSCQSSCGTACAGGCSTACHVGCGTSCASSCGGVCQSSCGDQCTLSGGCYTACGGTCVSGCAYCCGTGCSSGCYDSCTHACSTACLVSCGFSCSGVCQAACTYSCGGLCASSCGAVCYDCCSTHCGTGCKAACANGCGTSCASSCGAACQSSCGTECAGGCRTDCHVGCGTTCASSCGTSCQSSCGTLCAVLCSSACTGSCNTTCTGFAV